MFAVLRAFVPLLLFVCWAVASVIAAAPPAQPQAQANRSIYLPLIARIQPMPFGVETTRGWMSNAAVTGHAKALGIGWVRLNAVLWRRVQPTRGAPYDVAGLKTFERDLQAALAARLTPVVIVNDSPDWATINRPHKTSCGAIR